MIGSALRNSPKLGTNECALGVRVWQNMRRDAIARISYLHNFSNYHSVHTWFSIEIHCSCFVSLIRVVGRRTRRIAAAREVHEGVVE